MPGDQAGIRWAAFGNVLERVPERQASGASPPGSGLWPAALAAEDRLWRYLQPDSQRLQVWRLFACFFEHSLQIPTCQHQTTFLFLCGSEKKENNTTFHKNRESSPL